MSGEKILLIEDNDAVALGLQYALDDDGYWVTRVATVLEAKRSVDEGVFNLIILDIRLPDGSGFDLCRDFRALGVQVPIIMLTAKDETIDKVVGLELGADDYLTKPFELSELSARLRALLRRSSGSLTPLGSSRLNFEEISLDTTSQLAFRGKETIHLTSTEYKLLSYLARHRGRAITRQELIEQVWGGSANSADLRTVDVHIRNLRQKIEQDPERPRLVLTVRGAGYKLTS
jgi:DNA-binding response OmpR family regulator